MERVLTIRMIYTIMYVMNRYAEVQRYDRWSTYRKVRDGVAIGAFAGGALLAGFGGIEHTATLVGIGAISEDAALAVAVVGRLVGPRRPQEPGPYAGIG